MAADLQHNFKTANIQAITNLQEIVPAHHKVTGHWIAQLHSKENLRQLGASPGAESSNQSPVGRAAARHVPRRHDEIGTVLQFLEHFRENRGVVLRSEERRVGKEWRSGGA